MKIPSGCELSASTNAEGVMALQGKFTITTQADVELMCEALQAMGQVLSAKKPRKRKANAPRAVKAA